MTIENFPVWSFEPEWSSSVSEMLEWLTDIMASPDGSEQRRSLRYFPRRTVEFSAVAEGDARQLLDNLLISFGGSKWYVPIWYDVSILDAATSLGMSAIDSVDALDASLIKAGAIVCIMEDDPYTYELAEVASLSSTGLNLVAPLARTWASGARIFPVAVGELTDQPQLNARTSNLVTTQVRFRILDVEHDAGEAPVIAGPLITDVYREFYVLAMEPERQERMNLDYERKFVELDNQSSTPRRWDEAGRPFSKMQVAWLLDGRSDHSAFAQMMQVLRGRSQPVWVPTYMDDFILRSDIQGGEAVIDVKRCGFTAAGGPRWDRNDIMIETVGGSRFYRRIIGTAESALGETLLLDRSFEDDYPLSDILRISFIALMRLNHDSIEIEHSTDTVGVSNVSLTFRSAPDTRVAESAFNE